MATRIVYVDDSELSLEAVKDGLEPLGFEVTTHRNPLTIYKSLSAARPELLLLDAQMPTVGGKVICGEVKRRMKQLPIALFSSLEPSALQSLVTECGADGYIVKTGDFPAIAAEIRRLIAQAQRPGRGGPGAL